VNFSFEDIVDNLGITSIQLRELADKMEGVVKEGQEITAERKQMNEYNERMLAKPRKRVKSKI
jgi:hypothetical protein